MTPATDVKAATTAASSPVSTSTEPEFKPSTGTNGAGGAGGGGSGAGSAAGGGGGGLQLLVKIVLIFMVLAVVGVAVAVPLIMKQTTDNVNDNNGSNNLFQDGGVNNPGNGNGPPTDLPRTTSLPTRTGTESPTTLVPSNAPTTLSPTTTPSSVPTSPPTIAPTSSKIPVNPVPNNPPRGYFNYDLNDRNYGPNRWNRVDTSNHPLREFSSNGWGPWKNHFTDGDPTRNQCDGPDRRQSPKDMTGTVPCDAHHEIRTWCGLYAIGSEEYEKEILPHKLSLKMPRRDCLDVLKDDCKSPRPPLADYPRYSSTGGVDYSDLINYDIKVPGEHTLEGVSFDAEIQMLHIHPATDRISSIGVPVRAVNDESIGYNYEFQRILNQFQWTYDSHVRTCNRRQLRRERNEREQQQQQQQQGRKLRSFWEFLTSPGHTEEEEEYEYEELEQMTNNKFNPYVHDLMPTIFFYRYDGSITEPPCKDITWWVMMEPMIISVSQLEQLKTILFTNIDPNNNCQPTSVHNEQQSVARPIYPLGSNRDIEKCSPGIFISDLEKGRPEGNQCR